jgi:hypothetical protein
MTEAQKELLETAKRALKIIAVEGKETDFVFELRDIIRKVENERRADETQLH